MPNHEKCPLKARPPPLLSIRGREISLAGRDTIGQRTPRATFVDNITRFHGQHEEELLSWRENAEKRTPGAQRTVDELTFFFLYGNLSIFVRARPYMVGWFVRVVRTVTK